ncbi:MAG: HAD family hydrolase [Betaproteobacteria bacterium]|nr:HAD family hydrolase [Betaproteobacteria bacterium]
MFAGTRAVLFDFDGTLADTAADLARPVNRLRAARGLSPLPLESLRPFASSGARGLLEGGLGILPDHAEFKPLREAFLQHYADEICVDTRLFPGIDSLLAEIETRGLRWGIVTNKSTLLTRKIVAALGLEQRAACVVCGDTTAHLKPHPVSLLHAASELGIEPAHCVYLGDDQRDVDAARAAGMRSVAVEWGYGSGLESWQADAIIAQPMDLIGRLRAPT